MIMKKQYCVVGNWKMNPTSFREVDEYIRFCAQAQKQQKVFDDISCWLATPSLYMEKIHKTLFPLVEVGSQDISTKGGGSYTGEISAEVAQNAGTSFSLVGHSERRQYHGETDEDTAEKISQLLKQKMKAILCVGEGWEEREQGRTQEKIRRQITTAFQKVKKEDLQDIFVAYEPIWAVGSDRTPSGEEIREVKNTIQEIIKDMYGKGEVIKVLYGGSVHSENTQELIVDSGMDGGLIGRSSIDPKEFLDIATRLQ